MARSEPHSSLDFSGMYRVTGKLRNLLLHEML